MLLLRVLSYASAFAGLAVAVEEPPFAPRPFDGWGNNEENPDWGVAGTSQVRRVRGLQMLLSWYLLAYAGRRGPRASQL